MKGDRIISKVHNAEKILIATRLPIVASFFVFSHKTARIYILLQDTHAVHLTEKFSLYKEAK